MRNEVHIWQASMDDAKPYADPLMATLNDDEKSKGERLIRAIHRQRYLLAHAIVRNVLSRYIHQPPEEIQFKTGPHGKPYVEGTDWQFNLTHSNELLLIAVTHKSQIGIDVEFLESTHRFDDLVERFFSDDEQQEYHLYESKEARRLAFYRGWTRKEAYLKATGLGLSYPLDQFSVSLAPDERHALLSVEHDASVRTRWTLLSFDATQDYLASLAIEAPAVTLKTYLWGFSSQIEK